MPCDCLCPAVAAPSFPSGKRRVGISCAKMGALKREAMATKSNCSAQGEKSCCRFLARASDCNQTRCLQTPLLPGLCSCARRALLQVSSPQSGYRMIWAFGACPSTGKHQRQTAAKKKAHCPMLCPIGRPLFPVRSLLQDVSAPCRTLYPFPHSQESSICRLPKLS